MLCQRHFLTEDPLLATTSLYIVHPRRSILLVSVLFTQHSIATNDFHFHACLLLEYIANRNSTQDHYQILKSFMMLKGLCTAQFTLRTYLVLTVTVLLKMHVSSFWPAVPGKPISKILMRLQLAYLLWKNRNV